MRRIVASVVLLGAAGCGGGESGSELPQQPVLVADEFRGGELTGARKNAVQAAPVPEADGGTPLRDNRYLAYSYAATLRLPSPKVKELLAAHEQVCIDAGPSVCQVLQSSLEERSADTAYGSLSLSASRDYMTRFRDGLAAEASAARGSVVSSNARVEDLTRQIVDTGARLKAQEQLRERLLELLQRDTGDVGDLLQVERELARVQSEIESAQSYLRQLEGRVTMDRMTLRYEAIRKPVTSSTARPLQEAFASFFTVIAESLAAVILFTAAALPWLIFGIPGILIIRRIFRARWKPRGAKSTGAQSDKAPMG